MAVGYEARARVTADMSGFVTASREAADGGRQMATALRELNEELKQTQQLANASASAMRPFQQSTEQTTRSQRQAADATDDLAAAMADGADQYNAAQQQQHQYATATQEAATQQRRAAQATEAGAGSLRSMGREMERLERQQTTLNQVQRRNGDLTDLQAQAMDTVTDRLTELRTRYDTLNEEQQETVDTSRQLAQAQRSVSESQAAMSRYAREMTVEQKQVSESTQDTTVRLQAMGRELNKLRQEMEPYTALQQMGVQLNRDQQESFNALQARVNKLTAEFIRLSASERATVTTTRELAQASRVASQAIEEQDGMQARLARTGALSHAQLRSLGQEVGKLTTQRSKLIDVQRQQGYLDTQQQQTLDVLNSRLRELGGIYNQLNVEQKQLVTSTRQLAAAQGLVNESTREVSNHLRAVDRAAQEMEGSLWSLRSAVGDAASGMQDFGYSMLFAAEATWQNFSAQEMAIAQISRVSQSTALEMEQITASVREMSTEIPIAFEELGRITMLGSQVGVSNAALEEFTETVALFSATSEISADQTATLMARIMEMADLPEDQVTNLGSAVAYLGSNSAATDKEILTTIESIATMTTSAGMSAEATIGLASAMASLRVRPELARGAAQRVFLDLSSAVQGTGSQMQLLTDIAGMTQDELLELRKSNYDEFFMRIMEGLSRTADSGRDLIPVLRQLGITNTRDAEVVARLAENYNVLTDSIDGATTSFADGTYLYSESERIFTTLTSTVQILRNVFSNFMFDAFAAVAPFAEKVVEVTTATIKWLDEMGAAPVVGWSGLILGAAGAVGALAAAVGFAYQGILGFQGLLSLWGQRSAATAAANAGLAASNTAVAASSRTVAVSSAMASAANLRMASSATAGTVATTGLAASMGAATTAMRTFITAHPVLTVVGLAAAVVTTAVAFGDFGDSVAEANEKVLDANEAHITAAGGLTGLKQALDADTESWREAREAAMGHIDTITNNTGTYSSAALELMNYSNYRVESAKEMTGADREAAEEAQALAERQEELATELGTTAEESAPLAQALRDVAQAEQETQHEGAAAVEAVEELRGASQTTTETMQDSAYAVGLATRQWAALSLESAVLETNILKTEEAFERFQSTGTDLSAGLTLELRNAGDGAEYFRDKAQQARVEMGFWERDWNSFVSGVDPNTGEGLSGFDGWLSGLIPDSWATDMGQTVQDLEYLADNLDATSLSIKEATTANELLADSFVTLPDGTRATVAELQGFTEGNIEAAAATEVMKTEIDALGISIETLHGGFTSFIDPLQAWNDAQALANERAREADEEFGKLGENAAVSFDDFMTNLEEMSQAQMTWAQNLLNLADEVPPEVLAGLSEMGVEGAGIVQGLVDASGSEVDRFVQLWEQGSGMASDQFSVMFSDFLSQAISTGDTAGTEFVMGLMDEVAAGDISFREAVDEMTAYAEDEFQNADTTNEPQLENTRALNELSGLLRRIEADMDYASDAHKFEPEVEEHSLWDQIVDLQDAIQDWLRQYPFVWNVLLGGDRISASDLEGYADGGWINGAGGPREDKTPIMASDGEFMVNAWSAQRYARELEWINSQGPGGGSMDVPSFVPDNIMDASRNPLPNLGVQMPDDLAAAMRTNSVASGPRTVITVNNYYPKAEAASATVNRSLAFAASLDGT